jgi:DNA-binding IclR family transcriptional regulator
MSSGPFTYALSAAAAFIIRSLQERPELQTADEIAGAQHARGDIDASDARDGLDELGRRGLAEQDADGRWSLTDAGRKAVPRSA